jgi:hypothetical protein
VVVDDGRGSDGTGDGLDLGRRCRCTHASPRRHAG